MLNVGRGFRLRERADFVADRHALAHLPQLARAEQFHQFRLSNEHHLDQLVPGRLEVRDEPDLLQHLRRQRLGVVDEHHHFPAGHPLLHEELVEGIDQILGGLALVPNAELPADALQEFPGRRHRAGNKRRLGFGRDLPGKDPAQGRLADAPIAGDDREPLPFGDGVPQMRGRLLVMPPHEKTGRVEGKFERAVFQSEELQKHASSSRETPRRAPGKRLGRGGLVN